MFICIDPETAVLGAAFHTFEWLFVRAAPVLLIAAGIGIFLVHRKEQNDTSRHPEQGNEKEGACAEGEVLVYYRRRNNLRGRGQ